MDRPPAGFDFQGKNNSQNSLSSKETSGLPVTGNGIPQAGAPSTALKPSTASALAGDDFLTQLLVRNTSLEPPGNTLKPRLPSRFEPESTQSVPFTPEFLEISSSNSPKILSSLATGPSIPGWSGSYSGFQHSLPGLPDQLPSASPLFHLMEQYPFPGSQDPELDRTPLPTDDRISENFESQSLFSLLDEMSSSGDGGHLHLSSNDQQTTGTWISALQSEVGNHPPAFIGQKRGLQNLAASGSQRLEGVPSTSGVPGAPDMTEAQNTASLLVGNGLPSAPPLLQVTIGRVEVRLISPAVAGRMKPGSESRSQPLEDYLRSGGPR